MALSVGTFDIHSVIIQDKIKAYNSLPLEELRKGLHIPIKDEDHSYKQIIGSVWHQKLLDHAEIMKLFIIKHGIPYHDYTITMDNDLSVRYNHNYLNRKSPRTKFLNSFADKEQRDNYIRVYEELLTEYAKSDHAAKEVEKHKKHQEDIIKRSERPEHKWKSDRIYLTFREFMVNKYVPRYMYQNIEDLNDNITAVDEYSMLDNFINIMNNKQYTTLSETFKDRHVNYVYLIKYLEKTWINGDIIVSRSETLGRTLGLPRILGLPRDRHFNRNAYRDDNERSYSGNCRNTKIYFRGEDGYKEFLLIMQGSSKGKCSYHSTETHIVLTNSHVVSNIDDHEGWNTNLKTWMHNHKSTPEKKITLEELKYMIKRLMYDTEFMLNRVLDAEEGIYKIFCNDSPESSDMYDTEFMLNRVFDEEEDVHEIFYNDYPESSNVCNNPYTIPIDDVINLLIKKSEADEYKSLNL